MAWRMPVVLLITALVAHVAFIFGSHPFGGSSYSCGHLHHQAYNGGTAYTAAYIAFILLWKLSLVFMTRAATPLGDLSPPASEG